LIVEQATRNLAAASHPLSRTAPRSISLKGADRRRRFMEIAAFLMCAAVVMGILQQFDRQVW
jgi:type IV secretory pathway TrbD component